MSQHTIATSDFDPNAMASLDGVYGLPFDTKTAAQVILPVPWEATVSYRTGTANAPEAVQIPTKKYLSTGRIIDFPKRLYISNLQTTVSIQPDGKPVKARSIFVLNAQTSWTELNFLPAQLLVD